MAKGINKVILIGNLGQDPELRTTTSGQSVASFSLATSESWVDKTSGQKTEKTEWHRITMWGRLGEIAGQYLHKGSKVYIEGRLQTRKWQDKEGADRYTTEIVANEMQMLDGRREEGERPDFGNAPGYAAPPQRASAPSQHAGASHTAFPSRGEMQYDEIGDDVPF